MEKKQYWANFGEFTNSDAQQQNNQDEFGSSTLPFAEEDGKGMLESATPRRDFLKYLGFSTAAAMVAASCEMPVRHSIPFVNRPQDIVPGEANYYATTFVSDGEVIPVVAKVRDGRPIKLEGNAESLYTKGGTSARMQASVLDLYDTARLKYPMAGKKEVSSFDALDKMIAAELTGPVVVLTGTVTSPSTKAIITEFLAKYPGSRQVQYDAISYSGMLLANEASYGRRAIPSYKFANAEVVVSIGADFLGTWLSSVEYQNDYTTRRKINEKNISMSKHYQLESLMSMTGANADERFTHKPSETGAVVVALLNAINGQALPTLSSPKLTEGIKKIAKELAANRGKALVVAGSNNPSIQVVVNAINEAIGANGTTIDWSAPLLTKQGIDTEMNTLIADMNSGAIGSLLIYDVNPAYDYYNSAAFVAALGKVKLSVAFSDKMDETAENCKYVIPTHHFLESWGDAQPKTGYFSMLQPTIEPLFKTRQFEDSLLKWSGNTTNYATYFKNYWTTQLGSVDAYNGALQKGVVEPAAANQAPATATFNAGAVATATTAIAGMKASTGTELVLYQNVAMGAGKQANNPWLLELPDPVTKATWENYVMISPVLAKSLFKIDVTNRREADNYEVYPEKPEVEVTVGGKKVLLPALIIPGMQNDTLAIAVGYGRRSKDENQTAQNIGRASANAGKNVFQLASFNGTTTDFYAGPATITATGNDVKVAITQSHSSYEGRHEVVKEITLNEFKKKPDTIYEERAKELEPWGGLADYRKEGTLYPQFPNPGVKWGMSIDLNSCYGCGACVVACHAENNVPVVGKSEVLRGHEMHWLRIDRYFSGNPDDADSIQTVFQPMLCQHCDNAPCENVCPVAATNHSSEGINQMIYNRCIGTRYCANNCPYKVRRFNWLDFTGADSFKNNQDQTVVGKLDDVVFQMTEPLTRMVLNPDVTVRSRGVIEKCSFCVQRLQAGKLLAKKENRTLVDSDAVTACAQACAAGAITFSNINNPESIVSKTRKENALRTFYVLEQIHTLPSISYMVKVRNTDEIHGMEGQHNRYPEQATAAPKHAE